ncbi:2OG-Fe(II) oxygenase [Streptomyces olindensis]|uniref:2OG-Fe(II) oxygenase n=1 Tax=Streptomyces olindensis TaxID=358823 RepID=UPI00365E4A67
MLLQEEGLSATVLRKLFEKKALAVQIRNYYPQEQCARLSNRVTSFIEACESRHERIYLSNVPAFTETVPDAVALARYLTESKKVMSELRHLCHPYTSPVDRLRCELDDLWPAGASLLRLNGSPLVFGMIRVWRHAAGALPHIDLLKSKVRHLPEACTFTEQIGVNMYVEMPRSEGGEGAIELWNIGFNDTVLNGAQGTYGYPRALLPEPDAVIKPEAGDLVLLRSDHVHAVRQTNNGQRITLSGFIGHSGSQAALRLWS